MPTKGYVTIEDYSKERSTTEFYVQDIGAGNYAAVTQDIDEIKDSIITVIEGEVRETGFRKSFPESAIAVASQTAQRENKWLCTFRDTTQFLDAGNTIANPGYLRLFQMSIGTADLQFVLDNDDADQAQGAVSNFFTDVAGNIRSPWNNAGNAPSQVMVGMRFVGRNT